MDLLQIALIFLILLLSIFLGLTGVQVFFILRDLKKALDKFNEGNLPSYGSKSLKKVEEVPQAKETKPNKKRFFRKTL